MLDYASAFNPFNDVEFLNQDATNMQDLRDDSFDYVLILNVIHELMPDEQQKMLANSSSSDAVQVRSQPTILRKSAIWQAFYMGEASTEYEFSRFVTSV